MQENELTTRQKTRLETKARRKAKLCRVIQLQLMYSKNQSHYLNNLFLEAKWIYNDNLNRLKNKQPLEYKYKTVNVRLRPPTKTEPIIYEEREIKYLSSHMQQAIKEKIEISLKGLKTHKNKGVKVGSLKYKKEQRCIRLKEHNNTYTIDFNKNKLRLQCYKGAFKLRGLNQLKELMDQDLEIASADLIKEGDKFYLNVCTYTNKKQKEVHKEYVSIDFGCSTQLTLDSDVKIEYKAEPSERRKKCCKKVSRTKKGSKNRWKARKNLRKAYKKENNQKKDVQNKVLSLFLKKFNLFIIIQNENIKGWMNQHGKSIQQTGIGSLIKLLKNEPNTNVKVVDRFFPSTKLCPKCGTKNKIPLSQRIYICECGFVDDRDGKSARCIATEGLKNIPLELGKLESMNEVRIILLMEKLNQIPRVKAYKTNRCGLHRINACGVETSTLVDTCVEEASFDVETGSLSSDAMGS